MIQLRSLTKRKAEFIEPQECVLVSELPDWTYEVKLDGYRAIGVKSSRETILYSRNHKNFNKRFPQIAEAFREDKDPRSVVKEDAGEASPAQAARAICHLVDLPPWTVSPVI